MLAVTACAVMGYEGALSSARSAEEKQGLYTCGEAHVGQVEKLEVDLPRAHWSQGPVENYRVQQACNGQRSGQTSASDGQAPDTTHPVRAITCSSVHWCRSAEHGLQTGDAAAAMIRRGRGLRINRAKHSAASTERECQTPRMRSRLCRPTV